MCEAKLITECFVRPENEVTIAERIYNLNPFDTSFLSRDNVQSGLLYAKPSGFSASSYLESLRSSLSRALVYFYPLAGRFVSLRDEEERTSFVYIDCTKGPGARLIHASAQCLTMLDVLSPNSDVPMVVKSFFDLGEMTNNYDGHTKGLLSVQMTELKDSVFLGFCFNHVVVDGVSIVHFLTVWSKIFVMGKLPSSIPLPIVQRPASLDGKAVKLIPFYVDHLGKNESVSRSMNEYHLRERVFRISPPSLKKLKRMANSEAIMTDNINISSSKKGISEFQALIAFVWKCITRIRKLPPNEVTTCMLSVDLRPRLKPALTYNHLGNYAVKAKASARVAELLGNTVGWAATLLQQSVAALDNKEAHELMSRVDELIPGVETSRSNSSVVRVGASSRFDLNEFKFGLGRLVAYHGGYGNNVDGKMNACMGTHGDGSVDLEICLAPNTMTALSFDEEFMCFASQHNGHYNHVSKM
ncbi:hypothetical protein RND81_02G207500 [Saponaria officinalis]|uniref:Uncharacterized protein n=1 Tax=Saponaria officinalis TaxID=3572 RepID=A0AAW1MYI2_SAPOF